MKHPLIETVILLLSLAAAVFMMASCAQQPVDPLKTTITTTTPTEAPANKRCTVEMIGYFADGTAYGGTRRIYIITDSTTKKSYFCVTGCGTSQMGSHTDGENTETHDE